MSRASDISDAAAQWLIRLDGQTSPDIWDDFQAWLDRDPRHRAAFIRLRVAWHHTDLVKSLRPADGTIDAHLLTRTRTQAAAIAARGLEPLRATQRKRADELLMPERRRVVAIAAAIAAAGVVAWFASYHLGWKTFETGVGDREKMELADGSTVDLNTNTQLNVRISGRRRDIMLGRGEARFHVAPDPDRPFYVVAGGSVVRAVGTEFSVRIHAPERVEVLVTEGRVAVGAPGAEANFENPTLLSGAPQVSAGEAADVSHNSVSVRPVATQDLERKLAWTSGYLAFQGETLDAAVQEFNRYNQRQIRIADPSIENLKVGGHFRTTDLDSFTAALRHSFGFEVRVADANGDIRLSAGDQPR